MPESAKEESQQEESQATLSLAPYQNPLHTGKRIDSSSKVEEPRFGGKGKDAKVGGPRHGGEGGDGHARHLQLPRQHWQHQELAAVVKQPEESLKRF